MTSDNREVWETRYRRGEGRVNYPFDAVVTFVLRRLKAAGGPHRVLDFGCGVGNHLWFLAENGYQAFGTDAAPTAVALARDALRLVDPSYPADARVLPMDGDRVPFGDSMFDAVIDRSSLGQCRAPTIRRLVGEIHRVLKPGGRYFGVNFADTHPDLRFGRALGTGDWCDFTAGTFKGLGARHFFSVAEVHDVFDAFEIADIRRLSEASLTGGGTIEQLIVEAVKP